MAPVVIPVKDIPNTAQVDLILRYPLQQLDTQGLPAPEYHFRSTNGGVSFLDIATNAAPDAPAAGPSDPYPTDPVEVQLTVTVGSRSRTSSMYVLPVQTNGAFDLSVPVQPLGWITPANLAALLDTVEAEATEVQSLRAQVEAGQAALDAGLANIGNALTVIPPALADIAQTQAALEAAVGTTAVATEAALIGKPAGGYTVIATGERIYWSGAAITSRSPLSASAPYVDATRGRVISKNYFGVHIDTRSVTNWQPQLGYGSYRVWDTGCHWRQIEISKGVYSWTALDAILTKCATYDLDVLYVLGQAPDFATSTPGSGSYNPNPIANIQDWRDWVTALAIRNRDVYGGRIKSWEIWNEPNLAQFWVGTAAQLVTLAQEARTILKAIDPTCTIVSPSPTGDGGGNGPAYLDQLLAAGLAPYVDVIACHLYVYPNPPEAMIAVALGYRRVMAAYGVDKPLWNTEITWSTYRDVTTSAYSTAPGEVPEPQATNYLIRIWLVNLLAGMDRVFLYGLGSGGFNALHLIDPTTQTVTASGTSFASLTALMTGARIVDAGVNGNSYTLSFVGADGKPGVWTWSTDFTTFTLNNDQAMQINLRSDAFGAISTPSTTTLSITPAPALLRSSNRVREPLRLSTIWQSLTDRVFALITATGLNISGLTGTTRQIQFQTGAGARWILRTNGDAESGGNAGSNLEISRRGDAGQLLATTMLINRASGNVDFTDGRFTVAGTYLKPFRLGSYSLWVEVATGRLRIKSGTPTSDADGALLTLDSELTDGSLSAVFTSATAAGVNISGAAGTTRQLVLQTLTGSRWIFRVNGDAESGGNAGSNLEISRRGDAGELLATTMLINRATGNVSFTDGSFSVTGTYLKPLIVNGVRMWDSGTGRLYTKSSAPANATDGSLLLQAGDSPIFGGVSVSGAAGTSRDLNFQTTTANRWIFRVENTAESGSNAGSNLQIIRRADDGSLAGTALHINRATGNVGLGGQVSPSEALHVTGNIKLSGILKTTPVAKASLTAAATAGTGSIATITDPAAGKSNIVYSTGVAWVYMDGTAV